MKIQSPHFKFIKKGFTLIEMLVAMLIFLIAIGIISDLLISGIRQQRMALSSQAILDQTSYTLEYMSRAFRFAKKEMSAGACLSQAGLNFEIPAQYQIGGNENMGTGLRFINHLQGDDCQEFFLENGQIKYWKQSTGETLPLTSTKLEVTSFTFNLTGKSQDDNLQPLVTIFLEVKSADQSIQSQKIKIQTSVSQRNLDIP